MDDNEKSLASVEQDILNNPVLLEKIEAQARIVAGRWYAAVYGEQYF